jgi:hypothetical protein
MGMVVSIGEAYACPIRPRVDDTGVLEGGCKGLLGESGQLLVRPWWR